MMVLVGSLLDGTEVLVQTRLEAKAAELVILGWAVSESEGGREIGGLLHLMAFKYTGFYL